MSQKVSGLCFIIYGFLAGSSALAQTAQAVQTTVQASATHAPVRAADPTARYHRFICLVHLIGTGRAGDAARAEYVPTSAVRSRSDILGWRILPTDDNKMAIVQFVAVDRGAFQAILADTRPEVRIFEIGKDSQAAIEAEMQKYRKGFTLDQIQVWVQ